MGDRPAWFGQGLCVGPDADDWFVEGAAQRVVARRCGDCPVRLDCAADALDNRVEYGVWGGLTERQRRALLRKLPQVNSWIDVLIAAHTGPATTRGG